MQDFVVLDCFFKKKEEDVKKPGNATVEISRNSHDAKLDEKPENAIQYKDAINATKTFWKHFENAKIERD